MGNLKIPLDWLGELGVLGVKFFFIREIRGEFSRAREFRALKEEVCYFTGVLRAIRVPVWLLPQLSSAFMRAARSFMPCMP